MTEYKVSPLTSYVKPGKLTITAHNDGKLAHNVAVIRAGRRDRRPQHDDAPGPAATIKLSLDPGTYRVLSSLSNDDPLGINGYIVVAEVSASDGARSASAASSATSPPASPW